MTSEVARLRLTNQQITVHTCASTQDVVVAFGAMQAQEYRSALWAVGLRLANASERDIEQALVSATIVRTWALRGTLHLVAAQDVRWILELVAPGAIIGSAGRRRQLGIDDLALKASRSVLTQALSDGSRLTRDEALVLLERADIKTTGQRGIHILRHLSLEGLLVQTAFTGRQTTFALLDALIPEARPLSREEALAELAWRYFSSHGPATLRDFAWWSGLGVADATVGIELVAGRLACEKTGEAAHWMPITAPIPHTTERVVRVLPGFDEYILGYGDRRSALDDVASARVIRGGMFRPAIVVDGRAVGIWRPGTRTRPSTVMEMFSSLDPATSRALEAALGDYGAFLDGAAASA
jgi:hypothetical protein